jgi:hypothetical protein
VPDGSAVRGPPVARQPDNSVIQQPGSSAVRGLPVGVATPGGTVPGGSAVPGPPGGVANRKGLIKTHETPGARRL